MIRLIAIIAILVGAYGLYLSWQTSTWLKHPRYQEITGQFGLIDADEYPLIAKRSYLSITTGDSYFFTGNVDTTKLNGQIQPGETIRLRVTDSKGFYDKRIVGLINSDGTRFYVDQNEAMDWLYRDAAMMQTNMPIYFGAGLAIGVLILLARRNNGPRGRV
jgi:hypothetical protein